MHICSTATKSGQKFLICKLNMCMGCADIAGFVFFHINMLTNKEYVNYKVGSILWCRLYAVDKWCVSKNDRLTSVDVHIDMTTVIECRKPVYRAAWRSRLRAVRTRSWNASSQAYSLISWNKQSNMIQRIYHTFPDSKIHGANVGLTWGQQDPGGPHVGHMNLAIRVMHNRYWFKQ